MTATSPEADMKVQVVTDPALADVRVQVVGDQVVNVSAADAGKVLQVSDAGELVLVDALELTGGQPVDVDGVTAAALARLTDTTVNGFVVELAGTEAGYGQGQAFMVLEEGEGDATDQAATGSVLFRVDSKGGIGTNAGIHVSSGLRKPYGGAQAVWIEPKEDVVHLVFTAPAGATKDFIQGYEPGGGKRFVVDKDGSMFTLRGASVVAAWVAAGDSGFLGARAGFNSGATGTIALLASSVAGQTADILRVALGATVYARFDKNGHLVIKKNAAPADADLSAGEMALWFDQTNGAAKLMVKAKQADGTVRTGQVALT